MSSYLERRGAEFGGFGQTQDSLAQRIEVQSLGAADAASETSVYALRNAGRLEVIERDVEGQILQPAATLLLLK